MRKMRNVFLSGVLSAFQNVVLKHARNDVLLWVHVLMMRRRMNAFLNAFQSDVLNVVLRHVLSAFQNVVLKHVPNDVLL